MSFIQLTANPNTNRSSQPFLEHSTPISMMSPMTALAPIPSHPNQSRLLPPSFLAPPSFPPAHRISNNSNGNTSIDSGANVSYLRILALRTGPEHFIPATFAQLNLPPPHAIWSATAESGAGRAGGDLDGMWFEYRDALAARTVLTALRTLSSTHLSIDSTIYTSLPSLPSLSTFPNPFQTQTQNWTRLPIVFPQRASIAAARFKNPPASAPVSAPAVASAPMGTSTFEMELGGRDYSFLLPGQPQFTTPNSIPTAVQRMEAPAPAAPLGSLAARDIHGAGASWARSSASAFPAPFSLPAQGDLSSLDFTGEAMDVDVGTEERTRRLWRAWLDGTESGVNANLNAENGEMTLDDLVPSDPISADAADADVTTTAERIGSDSSSGRDGDDEDDEEWGSVADNEKTTLKGRDRSRSATSATTAGTARTGTSAWWSDVGPVLGAFPGAVPASPEGLDGAGDIKPADLPTKPLLNFPPPPPQTQQQRLVPLAANYSSDTSASSLQDAQAALQAQLDEYTQSHLNLQAQAQQSQQQAQLPKARKLNTQNLSVVVPPHRLVPLPSPSSSLVLTPGVNTPFSAAPVSAGLTPFTTPLTAPPSALSNPSNPTSNPSNTTPATSSQCILTPDGKALASAYGPWELREVCPDPSGNGGANSVLLSWPGGYPLPRPSQVRPHPENAGHPPIMNTGNTGPLQEQPGDWRCGVCNYTNWLRRRVCQSCYPFADGNIDASKAGAQTERINAIANQLMLAARSKMGFSAPPQMSAFPPLHSAPSSNPNVGPNPFTVQHFPGPDRRLQYPGPPSRAGGIQQQQQQMKSTIAFPSLSPIATQAQPQPQSQQFTSTTAWRTSSIRAPPLSAPFSQVQVPFGQSQVPFPTSVPMQRQQGSGGRVSPSPISRGYAPSRASFNLPQQQGFAAMNATPNPNVMMQRLASTNARMLPRIPSPAFEMPHPYGLPAPSTPSPTRSSFNSNSNARTAPPPLSLGWSPTTSQSQSQVSPARSLRSSVSSATTFNSAGGWSTSTGGASASTAFSASSGWGSAASSPTKASAYSRSDAKWNGFEPGVIGSAPASSWDMSEFERPFAVRAGGLHASTSMSNLLGGGSNGSSQVKFSGGGSLWTSPVPSSVPTTPVYARTQAQAEEMGDIFGGYPSAVGSGRRVTLSSGLYGSGIW